ncbi:MAG: bifunctional oligoribonuclease/PAP phosphatase NrnA [Myxococcales bacterium]|nr:bifunctional oligoribonuclease/PAP phosphatase NrnA [Myxococcales bacterium]
MSVDWREEAEKLVSFLGDRSHLWLVSHHSPDGDGIGSAVALALTLERRGFAVSISHPGPIPRRFRAVDAFFPSTPVASAAPPHDGLIVIDCNDPVRLGSLRRLVVGSAAPRFVIDHHPAPPEMRAENVVCPSCSSTGQVLYQLFLALGWPLETDVASALSLAILYDTNSLRLVRGDAEPLRIAAELIDRGADWAAVQRELNASRSRGQLELMRRGLDRIRFASEARLAYSWVERDDFVACDCESDDARELVNWTNEIEGVLVGFVLIEEAPGRYKVSMRSNRGVPVDRIADAFGGGGHSNAASARIDGARDEVVAALVDCFHTVLKG